MFTNFERARPWGAARVLGCSCLLSATLVSAFACSVERAAPSLQAEERANGPAEAAAVDGSEPTNGYLRSLATVGNCSAVFIKTSENPEAPAYLLTAGRCVQGDLHSYNYEVRFNETVVVGGPASFDFLRESSEQRPTAAYVHAAYVTMKGSDIALIELNRTLGSLRADGIEPLALAGTAPGPGAPIELAGLTFEPGNDPAERRVRRVRCTEGSRRPNVVEQDSYWRAMHVNQCAELGTGATGGPALDQQGRVFGVFNTRFARSGPSAPCYEHYPCEVGAGPVQGLEGASYVVDTTAFTHCFDADGRFDSKQAGCELDRGIGAMPLSSSRIVTPTYGDPPVPGTWSFTLKATTETHYRYKVGDVSTLDCQDATGYSEPLPIAAGLPGVALPSEYGLYGLCLVTGSGDVSGPSWQAFRYPSVVVETVQPLIEVNPETLAVTPEQNFALGQQVLSAYRNVANAHAARFYLDYGAAKDADSFIFPDRTWRLRTGWDDRGGMSADVASFVWCHEMGHVVGGFPFKMKTDQASGLASGQYGSVISSEGNADYFAAKECLPKLWTDQPQVNAKFRGTVSEYAKTRCNEVWQHSDEQNLCYRTLAVAEAFGRWVTRAGTEGGPKLDTPDPTVLERTTTGYPQAKQCRVDTVLRGALCQTKFHGTEIPGLVEPFDQIAYNSRASEAAAAVDSCAEGPGARPSCWFIPNSPPPPDCMGTPAEGVCAVRDGLPVILACDPTQGVLVWKCRETDTCQIDETGLAVCVP